MLNISVSVSGSFHQHMMPIKEAVDYFIDAGVRVLSPADPRVVDSVGDFLFVASDQHRSIRLVQDKHLAAISNSDFLWLVAPDGYIGQSASLELGFAIAYGIPIFSLHIPPDLTLRQYVVQVTSIAQLINDIKNAGSVDAFVELKKNNSRKKPVSFLIDPSHTINLAHDKLSSIEQLLHNPGKDITHDVFADLEDLKKLLVLPNSK